MLDVLTIGSAVRDVFLLSKAFLVTPLPEFKDKLGECMLLGEKIDVDELVLTTGGGATNAAVTFARLGFATGVVSRVGRDEPGDAILADLRKRHIDVSRIKRIPDGTTAYSTLLTTTSGERTAAVFRGVCAAFSDRDVSWSRMNARAFYMTSLAGNTLYALKIAKQAKNIGAKLLWNPGEHELKKGKAALDPILRLTDVLLVNVEEAQELLGTTSRDPHALTRKLKSNPDMIVVLTDGANGAYAAKDDDLWFARPSGVKSVSRTGAGDGFGSAFMAALLKKYDIEDCLRVGITNAEAIIQKIGAKTGILKSWPSQKTLAHIRVRKMTS